MSLVRLRNVSKRYDSKLVLRNVYFRIDATDRVGRLACEKPVDCRSTDCRRVRWRDETFPATRHT